MLTIRPVIIVFIMVLSLKVSFTSFAQVTVIDSLTTQLRTLPDSKEKVAVLKRLSITLKNSDLDLANTYAKEMIAISRQIEYTKGIADGFVELAYGMKSIGKLEEAISLQDTALIYFQKDQHLSGQGIILNELGVLYLALQKFEEARTKFQNSLDIFQQLKDSLNMANEYLNIGITYEKEGLFSTALDYYFRCLEIDESLDQQGAVASDYMSIAIIFKKQKELESAIQYYKKALKLSEEIGDEYQVAQVLSNFGILYKDLKYFDSALINYQRALPLFEKLGSERGIASVYHNIAEVYYELNDLDKCKEMVNNALKIAIPLNNQYVLLVNNILLSRIHLKEGKLDRALELAISAEKTAEELGMLAEQYEISSLLSTIYEAANQFDKALAEMKISNILKDSLYNLDKNGQMKELQTKYETAEKESQIQLLNQEKELGESELKRKSLQQNMILAGVGVSAFVVLFLFRTYSGRQKQKQLLSEKKLEAEKREAERLHQLDEAKSRFFANIAHEFRTPLTLILGPADQIAEDTENVVIKDHAILIQQNASKLLTLINQLMDLSKLESGMVQLNPVLDDFIAFSKACVLSFQTLAEEKDIQISIQSDINELIMSFDREKMAVIFSNLIFNAIKFTEPFGQVNVHFKVPASSEFGVEVLVKDTGIGIAKSQLPYIFDRFYQVDDSYTRKIQGTGIGLALSKELVELHLGHIEVMSEENKGSCFIMKFPVLPMKASEGNKGSSTLQLSGDGQQTDAKILQKIKRETYAVNLNESHEFTLLVVEDNPEVRKFIVDIVQPFYNVLEAENGKIGCGIAVEQIPDLIISDVMMPEMDGFELCNSLKEDERTSHIPIIILTAKAGVESRIEGLNQGADDYLDKPFNARELLARVKNLIKIRQQLQLKYKETHQEGIFAPKEDAFLTKLKEVIEERIDQEEFSVVELGKLLAMSRTQVHRKLKALTGLSTSRFIRQYKLGKAHELLSNEQYNVSEIAYMLGFNTANYFSTCFHEQYGYPPSEITKKSIKKS